MKMIWQRSDNYLRYLHNYEMGWHPAYGEVRGIKTILFLVRVMETKLIPRFIKDRAAKLFLKLAIGEGCSAELFTRAENGVDWELIYEKQDFGDYKEALLERLGDK